MVAHYHSKLVVNVMLSLPSKGWRGECCVALNHTHLGYHVNYSTTQEDFGYVGHLPYQLPCPINHIPLGDIITYSMNEATSETCKVEIT